MWCSAFLRDAAFADNRADSQEYDRRFLQGKQCVFQEHELFPYLVEGQFNTRQDNYADCILVNILYHIDGKDLSASLIKASYYNPEMETVEVSLTESMQAEQIPNVDYFRYWHGGMVLLRPLLYLPGFRGQELCWECCF